MHILLGFIYIAFAAINSCIALMVYDAKCIWSKIMAGILLFIGTAGFAVLAIIQYLTSFAGILGKPLPYFETVCFRFRNISTLHQFNWLALHHNTRGLLYDANENLLTVTIVFSKGSQNIAKARQIAVGEMEAIQITPIL